MAQRGGVNIQASIRSGAGRQHDRRAPDRAAPGLERPGGGASPLISTADVDLLDHILAAAAATGFEPTVVADPPGLRPLWAAAPVVVVGSDLAPLVGELALPRRPEVYLAGLEADLADLWRWSASLGAAVVALPAGAGVLTAAIWDTTGAPGGAGRLIAVVGGCGGVGASSVAAALAVTAASDGTAAMLVDLDPLGGGIDLLVGAEAVAGWRWPRLNAAQGHLGDLTGQLPRVAGVDVLSTVRAEDPTGGPGVEAVRAVLASAVRSHRLVVVDLARRLDGIGREVLRRADHTVVVAGADVRATAAAQQLVGELRNLTGDLCLVVRRPRAGGVDGGLVADTLGLDLIGVVGHDASLRPAAERGDPPGRSARSPLSRLSSRVLAGLAVRGRSA